MCWKKINDYSSLINLILIAILVGVTICYTGINQKMLKEFRNQSEIANRPYVGIDSFSVVSDGSTQLNFTLFIKNFGETPACELKREYRKFIDEKISFFYENKDGEKKEIKWNETEPIIFGQTTTIFQGKNLERYPIIKLNHPFSYYVNKYNEIYFILNIYYRGIESINFQDFYKTEIKFTFDKNYKKWYLDWMNIK